MSLTISRVQAPHTVDAPQSTPSKNSGAGEFSSILDSVIQQVEQTRHNAAESVKQLLAGENEELHQTVLATQKAELQFEIFLQIRNKVVSAYQEVMKMQV